VASVLTLLFEEERLHKFSYLDERKQLSSR